MRRLLFLALLFCFTLPNLAQENEQTPYEIALQRINEAEANGETQLFLSGLGLTELPPEIGNLSNLQGLYLGNNRLSNLPPEIGNLSNLIALYLNNNQLSHIPNEIDSLINLRELILDYNQLSNIPSYIGKLINLSSLGLSNNQLSSLPPEIGSLINLNTIYLSNNQLSSLPPEIGSLNNLCWLFLENNQLQYLPIELSRIESLRGILHGNVNDCVTYNIVLDGNPLISPPAEVIAQGTPAILDYLENEAWWHLQRLIVGGASSLGLVAAAILGIRWRQRGKQKRKNASA
jgi:Leucine-rich repeat (LRR) protein